MCSMKAATSEPMKFSPSPSPTTRGELRRAATRQRLPIYEATHLANRAMVLMWGQTRGWEEAADSLLSLAMERLRTAAP